MAKKTKEANNKVSYHYKPDNMTLQQWQIALRQQTAKTNSKFNSLVQNFF